MGIRGSVSRGTPAHANEHRPWQVYADLAGHLIGKARRLYAGDSFGVELAHTVYALDATTVDLCLSVFPWAHFHSTKAAIKINTLLDLRGANRVEFRCCNRPEKWSLSFELATTRRSGKRMHQLMRF